MLKNGVEDIVIFAQIVEILAVATYVFSYQLKRRKNIILVNATSSILYVLQYIMLGAFEGGDADYCCYKYCDGACGTGFV